MTTLIHEATSCEHCSTEVSFTAKDLKSDQDVRWCAGCGDYAVLAQMQKILPELGIPRQDIVFVSGIGCSSRFPYYMNTYGFHSIHGRAPAIATGLAVARPELSVWVITGDGDALSIGGNHLIHALRRNVGLHILLFNNEIYGLTKGQYSPTTHKGKKTKSSPFGAVDNPFNPASLALGAGGTFVARTLDRDLKHLQMVLRRAAEHKGTSFVEIYQNCVVFNDGAFSLFTDKETKPAHALFIEHGAPLVFGANREFGIRLDGFTPTVVSLADGQWSLDDLLVHDEHDSTLAFILAHMGFMDSSLPRPFGVFQSLEAPQYEQEIAEQEAEQKRKYPTGVDLRSAFRGDDSWTVH